VDYKPNLRARIVIFFLISIPVWIVWGIIDACRYFFSSDKPTAREAAWMVGVYIAVWIIGGFFDQLSWNQKRLNDLESRVSAIEEHDQK
jgi:hypothetical protein